MTKCLHYRRGPPADSPGCALVSALSQRRRKRLGPPRERRGGSHRTERLGAVVEGRGYRGSRPKVLCPIQLAEVSVPSSTPLRAFYELRGILLPRSRGHALTPPWIGTAQTPQFLLAKRTLKEDQVASLTGGVSQQTPWQSPPSP